MKRFAQFSLYIVVAAVIAISAFFAYASHVVSKKHELAYPHISADRTPEGIARGEKLFTAVCSGCHLTPETGKVSGAHLAEIPSFLGTFYSANITSHPTGIGALPDAAIARMIRYGVNRHGELTIMPSFGMGDADIAAIIGFMRSNDPMFAPVDRTMPKSSFTLAAKTIFVSSGLGDPPARPANGVPVPVRAATVEYGRYMAQEAMDCGACHTRGFGPQKIASADGYRGGFEFSGADGQKIYSANLTSHESGLRDWSEVDFARAVRDGLRPDGQTVRPPMPRFRQLDDVDVAAIYKYLGTLPPAESNVPLEARRKMVDPAQFAEASKHFQKFGCSSCHGANSAYRDKLVAASTKSSDELAQWIRNPEKVKPGTIMPTYESMMDENTARALAEWIRSGRPGEGT